MFLSFLTSDFSLPNELRKVNEKQSVEFEVNNVYVWLSPPVDDANSIVYGNMDWIFVSSQSQYFEALIPNMIVTGVDLLEVIRIRYDHMDGASMIGLVPF
jgi:hypothetical protein